MFLKLKSLSNSGIVLEVSKRFASSAVEATSQAPDRVQLPKRRKMLTDEQLEFMRAYNLTAPAFNHCENIDHHVHYPSEHWSKVVYLSLPILGYFCYTTYLHEKHENEHINEVRPPYVDIEYMRIIRKPFPWGDGKHTLFHNPQRNPVPGVGYEK